MTSPGFVYFFVIYYLFTLKLSYDIYCWTVSDIIKNKRESRTQMIFEDHNFCCVQLELCIFMPKL